MSQAKDAGKRVTTAREAHELTATELSRRANVSRVTISAIEEGRALPRLETVESIAHALTVSPGWVGFGEPLLGSIQAPHFDELTLAAQLEAIANSVGGFVDQKFLYLETSGAAAWTKLESVREFPVLREVAELVAQSTRTRSGCTPMRRARERAESLKLIQTSPVDDPRCNHHGNAGAFPLR